MPRFQAESTEFFEPLCIIGWLANDNSRTPPFFMSFTNETSVQKMTIHSVCVTSCPQSAGGNWFMARKDLTVNKLPSESETKKG